jgi:hypothetical protein
MSTPALTATSDGTLWLAYRFDDTNGTERWSDVVLIRAPADPTAQPTEVWRRRTGRSGSNWLALESQGTRLTMATSRYTYEGGQDRSFIGVVALDTTKL